MDTIILIPAYNPDEKLIELVQKLNSMNFKAIWVVNDGSDDQKITPILEQLKTYKGVRILQHAVNLGKGAALKYGLNDIYVNNKEVKGIVTASADGLYLPEDIFKVAKLFASNPQKLTLGVREFDEKVPLRTKLSNLITRRIFKFFTGLKIKDTQTGLRVIPRNFIPTLLKIKANGYEFELDMLIRAKLNNIEISQEDIKTVYIKNNRSSRFNPVWDSIKIYFVFFRFTIVSILSALIDNLIFVIVHLLTQNILISQFSARGVSGTFNYLANKNKVFFSQKSVSSTLFQYFFLVIIMAFISQFIIYSLAHFLHVNVYLAKIITETILFIMSFSVQKNFIFIK